MNETRHYKDTEVVFSAYDTALNTCPLETVGWSAMSTYNSAKSSAWIILDCWFAASLTFPSEYHISDVVAYGSSADYNVWCQVEDAERRIGRTFNFLEPKRSERPAVAIQQTRAQHNGPHLQVQVFYSGAPSNKSDGVCWSMLINECSTGTIDLWAL